MMTHVMMEHIALEDTCNQDITEDDPIKFLSEEPTVAINLVRNAGLSEASHV